jgi:hypothetical protein
MSSTGTRESMRAGSNKSNFLTGPSARWMLSALLRRLSAL